MCKSFCIFLLQTKPSLLTDLIKPPFGAEYSDMTIKTGAGSSGHNFGASFCSGDSAKLTIFNLGTSFYVPLLSLEICIYLFYLARVFYFLLYFVYILYVFCN